MCRVLKRYRPSWRRRSARAAGPDLPVRYRRRHRCLHHHRRQPAFLLAGIPRFARRAGDADAALDAAAAGEPEVAGQTQRPGRRAEGAGTDPAAGIRRLGRVAGHRGGRGPGAQGGREPGLARAAAKVGSPGPDHGLRHRGVHPAQRHQDDHLLRADHPHQEPLLDVRGAAGQRRPRRDLPGDDDRRAVHRRPRWTAAADPDDDPGRGHRSRGARGPVHRRRHQPQDHRAHHRLPHPLHALQRRRPAADGLADGLGDLSPRGPRGGHQRAVGHAVDHEPGDHPQPAVDPRPDRCRADDVALRGLQRRRVAVHLAADARADRAQPGTDRGTAAPRAFPAARLQARQKPNRRRQAPRAQPDGQQICLRVCPAGSGPRIPVSGRRARSGERLPGARQDSPDGPGRSCSVDGAGPRPGSGCARGHGSVWPAAARYTSWSATSPSAWRSPRTGEQARLRAAPEPCKQPSPARGDVSRWCCSSRGLPRTR